MELNHIFSRFEIVGDFVGFEKLTSGNINETYLVSAKRNENVSRFVIQKINGYVFHNPQRLMKNVIEVTNHIRRKLSGSNRQREVMQFIPAKNKLPYFIDDLGNYWRAYKYIDDSITFEETDDLSIIEETGKAFGKFQLLLSDFDVNRLFDTIPKFHDTEKRFIDLFESAENDVCGRKNTVLKELEYLMSKQKYASFFTEKLRKGELCNRVTHNDTKFDNVLFDKFSRKALTVIDLDTVMSGLVAYDFGDGARSICSTSCEDERDHRKIDFDLDKFKAFAKGFLSKTSNTLTVNEISTLYMSPYVLTLELGARFLKDYLDGDLYFSCDYELHNLDRAENQIVLSKRIYDKLDIIKNIVDELK